MIRSIDPSIWGPSGWKVVHALASKASVDPSIVEVFPNLYLLLPCPACQQNYINHTKELPIPTNPARLLHWSFDLHQRVNQWKGKSVTIDFKDVQKEWKHAAITWEDAWIFVDAIVNSHPGATKVTAEYIDELALFFKALQKILPNIRKIKKSELVYKGQLRQFMKEIRKQHGVTAKSPAFTCSTEVCRM